MSTQHNQLESVSRRQLIKATAAISAAAMASGIMAPTVHAAATDKLRIGMIGCGRRGFGAAENCINSAPNLELVALGDVFKDRVDGTYNGLKGKLGDKFKVTPDKCFTGFDAYQKVINSDVDIVLLVTPPGFRPLHLKAAVEAGKHVFMEKPVAVDPAGVRSVIASAEAAKAKNLCLVAGTQRRHQDTYVEMMKRVKDGAIGQVTAAEVYWQGDYSYYNPVFKKPEWSDMEWQLRNWNYFTWLSGDHVVEQHVHNLDIARWAFGANPTKVMANGSRQVRTGPEFGHIFDNFSASIEFPGGFCLSMCRQMSGTSGRVWERILGTKGQAQAGRIDGENKWQFEGKTTDPYVQEHTNLVNAIRTGKPINEAQQIAESTMIAVMIRIAAYTGREINWGWAMNASKLDLTPAKFELGDLAVPPVAVPGQTKLI